MKSPLKHADLDAAESEYERKLARQQMLDQMEAALAGTSSQDTQFPNPSIRLSNTIRFWDISFCDDDEDSDHQTRSTTSKIQAPAGAIESARRFLWDEDDDDEVFVTTSLSTPEYRKTIFERYLERWKASKSKKAKTKKNPSESNESSKFTWKLNFGILPAWQSPRGVDRNSQKFVENLAPNQYTFDAHNSEPEKTSTGHKLRECLSSWCDYCFMALFHCFLGFIATICEYGTAWLSHVNAGVLSIFGLLGVSIFILIWLVITFQKLAPGGTHDTTTLPTSYMPQIQNKIRYEKLHQTILESAFTSSSTLDLPTSPQKHALQWLTDQDPAQLRHDDDALLQRYALATFYFSTYAFEQVKNNQSNGKPSTVVSANEWTRIDNWMSEKGICIWYGVSCIPHLRKGEEEFSYDQNSNVVRLNLTDNNIRGIIPSELNALEDLISLDLSRNKLSGSIPTFIGALLKLSKSRIFIHSYIFSLLSYVSYPSLSRKLTSSYTR
jgi:hypothetical protein